MNIFDWLILLFTRVEGTQRNTAYQAGTLVYRQVMTLLYAVYKKWNVYLDGFKWFLCRYCSVKFVAQCHDIRTTFERPENDQDAHSSPKLKKFCFCVTAVARLLWFLWTNKTAVDAQVAQRRQSGGLTIAMVVQGLENGGTVVATVIGQMDSIGRPKEARWWCKGGRSIAQI